jgi:hypothetical protein
VTFAPGESGNPSGRKPGSKNKRTQEILDLLQERGDKDPLDFLSEVITQPNHYPAELKLQAANYLAPYLHSKYGTKIPPRYIMEPVVLPHPEPTSIDQANANINYISARKAAGTIELDFADSLIADNCTIANNIIAEEELRLKMIGQHGAPEQTIRIEGGLPELPGTNITMPILNNGHVIDVIAAPSQDPEPPSNVSVPVSPEKIE